MPYNEWLQPDATEILLYYLNFLCNDKCETLNEWIIHLLLLTNATVCYVHRHCHYLTV